MKLAYILSVDIRDFHGHVEEWVVYATSREGAIELVEPFGLVLSCRRADAVLP